MFPLIEFVVTQADRIAAQERFGRISYREGQRRKDCPKDLTGAMRAAWLRGYQAGFDAFDDIEAV
jgi:hypothetical protein